MSLNLISLDITAEQQAAALAALAQLEAALPGLVSLEPDERRKLLWMGDKSEVFCRTTIRVLGDHPQIVPPSLDVAGAQADLVTLDRLRPVFERLARLHSQLDDTTSALGNDVMDVALDGYGQIKLVGDAYGLKELRKEIGGRWARGPRKPEVPAS